MVQRYYDAPQSLNPLPTHLRPGLIVISVCALLSLIGCTIAGGFILYRICNGKRYQTTPLRFNQSLILILNLLIADFQQALSFAFSLHWVRENAILAPTDTCAAQGWFVQIGDISSGLFSLAIALQTFYIIVMQRNLDYKVFVGCVVGIWAFCLILSLISPIRHHGEKLFVSAGAWCWIDEKFHDERLFVHYLWIFFCEFGSIAVYAVIFVILRRNAASNAASGVQNRTIQRVARLMLVYPVAYTCLTLPLAAYRMASQSGKPLGDTLLLFAGACMASCGWVDVILYLVTRRTIVSLQQHSLGSGQADTNGNGIPMDPRNLPYGNSTVVGGGDRGNGGEGSVASSQERFVKMEHVVQVTVESATPSETADGNQKPMGNTATATGTN